MAKLSDDRTDEVYGKAEECLGQTAEALKRQALLAWDLRTTPDAMRILSFVWGRNARHLSRAVARWPGYFMGIDDQPIIPLEPDEYQVLFMLAALPGAVAEEMRLKWKRYGWRAWRVREAVEDWRGEQKDPKLMRLRASGRLFPSKAQGGMDQLTINLDPVKGGIKPEWVGKRVTVLLTEAKDA